MKLKNEQRRVERQSKPTQLLNPELPEEPSLNEKVGLTPEVEKQIRSFLEEEPVNLDLSFEQLATIVDFIVLFPKEGKNLIDKASIDKMVPELEKRRSPNDIYSMYYAKRLMPNHEFLLPKRMEEDEMRHLGSGLELDRGSQDKLSLARSLITLAPHRAQEVRAAIKKILENLNNINLASEGGLSIANSALLINPELHSQLHALALSQRYEIDDFLQQIKEAVSQGLKIRPLDLVRSYAPYKLLLADEIAVGPYGVLAVEKPALTRGRALPERSLVA